MSPHTFQRVFIVWFAILSLGFVSRLPAQSLRTVVEPQARVFPTVGPGVTAVKRDSSGRYYVLRKPANVIFLYDSDGNPIGQIPKADSPSSIRYAVGIDLSPDGKLVVADRLANAIEVFDSDGNLLSKIPVEAPTSAVALSGGLFAVTSLTSDRLVQVVDKTGYVVRTFGDPANIEDLPSSQSEADKRPMVDWGKIVGSSAGDIYFAFTSLPEPLLRRYDQYGYAGFEASVPREFFDQRPSSGQDRVEFAMNFTHLSFSDQTAGTVTFGSSGDVKFSGGIGTGLGRILGSGGSFGRTAAQLSVLQAANGGANGMAGGSIGGLVSGQISGQGAQLQFGAGNISSIGGGRGRRSGGGGGSNYDLAPPAGSTLRFFGSSSDSASSGDSQILAYSGSNSVLQQPALSDGQNSSDYPPDANLNSDLSAAFSYAALTNAVAFQPPPPAGIGGGMLGHFPGRGGLGHPGGGEMRFAGNPFGDGQFRPRRFGAGEGDVKFTMRVNLGELGSPATEKPRLTATAVDPAGDLWAGVGDALIHYNKDGIPVEVYYLALRGGQPLRPTALLIEKDRFLVAADPWGIFEFARTP